MRFYHLLLGALFFSCTNPSQTETDESLNAHGLRTGHWLLSFDIDPDQNIQVHQQGNIDTLGNWILFNGSEAIHTRISSDDSLIYIELPYFNSYLSAIRTSSDSMYGHWYRPDRGEDYKIPFTASHQSNTFLSRSTSINTEPERYAVRFSPDTPNEYPAVGQFAIDDDMITGTFLTETGDYRFLEGREEGENYILQCFDGSHLFLFQFSIQDDSLTGVFRSGNTWKEPFKGVKDPNAKLRDPFMITHLIDDRPLEFTAIGLDGEMETFSPERWANSLSVVQIFGSWCPNCLDESRFLAELAERYKGESLNIYGIAFERGNDFQTSSLRLQRYARELQLPYSLYLGGTASKGEAHKLFPMLNSITSFPTTLLVDQRGKIVLIQTGFSGPGTGDEYLKYTQQFEDSLNRYLQASQAY